MSNSTPGTVSVPVQVSVLFPHVHVTSILPTAERKASVPEAPAYMPEPPITV